MIRDGRIEVAVGREWRLGLAGSAASSCSTEEVSGVASDLPASGIILLSFLITRDVIEGTHFSGVLLMERARGVRTIMIQPPVLTMAFESAAVHSCAQSRSRSISLS